MLGKTAGGLYWMSRYLERSENMARMIEAGQRIALTRSRSDDEWKGVLRAAGVHEGYAAQYDTMTKDQAIDWMLRDTDNPSSVRSMTTAARANAKTVRTALTREVWENVNGFYMTVRDDLARKVSERDLPAALTMIRQKTALIRGAMHGTMLRNDIYDFSRIGTFVERADNTARILDVKYYVLLPRASGVGSSLDNVQWQSILHSVSGAGGYRMAYGQKIRPYNIARFLIRDRRMPRSLAFCCDNIRDNLGYIAEDYDGAKPCDDAAASLCGLINDRDIDEILQDGLHEFLQSFLKEVRGLNLQIEQDYRFHA